MIAFVDVNTIWRRKFAEALARRVPATMLAAPHAMSAASNAEAGDLAITLPPGWAGATSRLAMPLLRYRLDRAARARGERIRTVVLTTPHYRPLLRNLRGDVAVVYYASDDYRSYAGWDSVRMARDEGAICRDAALSIFVSEPLRARAVAEYGLDPALAIVSQNATEPRFAEGPNLPAAMAALARPIFGTAGVLNARIDLEFLLRVAGDGRVGSLALVGPVEPAIEHHPTIAALRANAKVHFFGRQPHSDMPAWMAAFDVALIPYATSAFNHFCSPMRLYDHLAIGHPILATRHCAQVAADSDVLSAGADNLPEMIARALASPARARRVETWDDRIAALQKSQVAATLFPE